MPAATFLASYSATLGNQDFTLPGFGTPEVVIIERVHAPLGTNQTDRRLTSMGFIHNLSGIQQFAAGTHTQSGNYPNAGSSCQSTSDCLYIRSPGDLSDAIRASCTAFITDGVRLNFTATSFDTSTELRFTFFKDMVDAVDIGTMTRTAGSVVTGFEPDVIFAAGTYGTPNSTVNQGRFTRGIAFNSGTPATQQAGFYLQSFDLFNGIFSLAGGRLGSLATSGGTSPDQIKISAYNVDGFTKSIVGTSSSSAAVGYMAIKFKPTVQWQAQIDVRDGTETTVSVTTPWEPQLQFFYEANRNTVTDDAGSWSTLYKDDGTNGQYYSNRGVFVPASTSVRERASILTVYLPDGGVTTISSWTFSPTGSERIQTASSADFETVSATLLFGSTAASKVYVGDAEVAEIYAGDTPVTAVYVGDTLVWGTE